MLSAQAWFHGLRAYHERDARPAQAALQLF
jgi:hypothetical protein